MNIIEIPLNEERHPGIMRKAYNDIGPEFVNMKEGSRVLPVSYFEDPSIMFTLRKKFEPGEHKLYPEGGYEVIDVNGGIHCLFLDQLILHPNTIGMKRAKQSNGDITTTKKYVKTGGKRGRKPLEPEEKLRRDELKIVAQAKSGGKRGRPKGTTKTLVVKAAKVGKRGRPSLTQEEKLKRDNEKLNKHKKSGGKRGRPSKQF